MTERFSYRDIPGYCNFHSLYKTVLDVYPDDAHFVEVGAWLGHSAAYMGELIKNSEKRIQFDVIDIWEIGDWSDDPHRDIEKGLKNGLYQEFLDNIKKCGVEEFVNPIKDFSKNAVSTYKDRSLDFVFIDADNVFE